LVRPARKVAAIGPSATFSGLCGRRLPGFPYRRDARDDVLVHDPHHASRLFVPGTNLVAQGLAVFRGVSVISVVLFQLDWVATAYRGP
jgi:hypothetical protein